MLIPKTTSSLREVWLADAVGTPWLPGAELRSGGKIFPSFGYFESLMRPVDLGVLS